MTRMNYTFTSESVSEGHPDKVCDRISDAVLDAFLAEEPEARVAAETFATTNRVVIGGEVGLSDPGQTAKITWARSTRSPALASKTLAMSKTNSTTRP